MLGNKYSLLFVATLGLLTTGCSDGKTGQVSGVVQLDGKPLAQAVVEFYPVGSGAASAARTNDDGYYELRMGRDTTGAVVGDHKVQIWSSLGQDTEDSSSVQESVPSKYNVKTELTKTVIAGRNHFNFDLEPVSAAELQANKKAKRNR